MKRQFILILSIFSTLLFCTPLLHASKSKAFKSEEDSNFYLTTHYNLGCEHYNRQAWQHASREFEKVIYWCPCTEAAAEASYYLAICYFEMKEYDFANEEFSNYLTASHHPAFFEDAVTYKFCIAEHFKAGKKKRPFKMRYLPKWVSAQDSALTIYDEVVAALPNHALTIQALYSKAELLMKMGEYRECVEAYQTIIRRFPKHEIVPICYLKIAEAYCQQSRYEFQNPDILALAELNVRKFRADFPRDERVALAEKSVCHIKEMYAKGLRDLGLFYERMKKPDAAAIYYQSSIEEFPDTYVAQFCRSRLICLGYGKEEETAACVEERTSSCAEKPTFIQYQPKSCVMQEEEPLLLEEMPSTEEATPLPPQEFVHYSLLKKPQQSCNGFERVDVCRDIQENRCIEGNIPPPHACDPHWEENAPYLMHYSQLKHRDQYVTPQE